jgi:hypothetical protein
MGFLFKMFSQLYIYIFHVYQLQTLIYNLKLYNAKDKRLNIVYENDIIAT